MLQGYAVANGMRKRERETWGKCCLPRVACYALRSLSTHLRSESQGAQDILPVDDEVDKLAREQLDHLAEKMRRAVDGEALADQTVEGTFTRKKGWMKQLEGLCSLRPGEMMWVYLCQRFCLDYRIFIRSQETQS
jgi:hypothetical protein